MYLLLLRTYGISEYNKNYNKHYHHFSFIIKLRVAIKQLVVPYGQGTYNILVVYVSVMMNLK